MNNTYWNNYYSTTEPQAIPWKGNSEVLLQKIISKYKLPTQGDVLDIGCGTGEKADFLQKLGYNVDAFDISEVAIEKAKELNPDVNFFVADAGAITDVKKFDIIVDLLASQFVLDKTEFLKTLPKILKQGGFYILIHFGEGVEMTPGLKKIARTPEQIKEDYPTLTLVDSWYKDHPVKPVGYYIFKK